MQTTVSIESPESGSAIQTVIDWDNIPAHEMELASRAIARTRFMESKQGRDALDWLIEPDSTAIMSVKHK